MAPLVLLVAALGQVYGTCPPVRTYAARTYAAAAYAAPVAAPAYNQTLIVGVPVAKLGVQYYYSTGDGLAAAQLAQLVDQQVTARLNAALLKPAMPAAAVMPAPAPAPNPLSSGAVFGEVVQAAPSPPVINGSDENTVIVSDILANRCSSCHGPGVARKGIQLYDASGALFKSPDFAAEVQRRSRIYQSVAHAAGVMPMPKNATALPQAEVDAIRQWLTTYASSGGSN